MLLGLWSLETGAMALCCVMTQKSLLFFCICFDYIAATDVIILFNIYGIVYMESLIEIPLFSSR